MRRARGVRVVEEDPPGEHPGDLYSDPSQDLKDRYGRLLRYVHKSATGKDVNRQQVYLGHARVYVYNHNPFRRVSGYKAAATQAKSGRRGIWGSC